MLVKASVYFGSVCEMRESVAVAWRRGVDVAARLSNRWLVRGPVADATRDLFVRPHGLRRNVRGAGLACAAPRPRSSNYECQMLSHATVRRAAVRTPLRRSS